MIYSVNLAFWPKPGFKNKCQARAGFGDVISRFKMRLVYNSGHYPFVTGYAFTNSTFFFYINTYAALVFVSYLRKNQ